ncbi:hypothetical protein [Streptomyces gilvosporeus]|nr:hypothetical protein [Streptomyces gilvosporeus]
MVHIAVLYRFYAKLLRGMQARANELIDQELGDAGEEPQERQE